MGGFPPPSLPVRAQTDEVVPVAASSFSGQAGCCGGPPAAASTRGSRSTGRSAATRSRTARPTAASRGRRRPDLGHVPGAGVAQRLQGPAGVGDVVGHQHPRAGRVDDVEGRRQHHREVEPLVDAGVELHVHHEQVLDVEAGLDVEGIDRSGLPAGARHELASGGRQGGPATARRARAPRCRTPRGSGPRARRPRRSMVPGGRAWAPGETAGRLAA